MIFSIVLIVLFVCIILALFYFSVTFNFLKGTVVVFQDRYIRLRNQFNTLRDKTHTETKEVEVLVNNLETKYKETNNLLHGTRQALFEEDQIINKRLNELDKKIDSKGKIDVFKVVVGGISGGIVAMIVSLIKNLH